MGDETADEIAAFWTWWDKAKHELAGAIDRREPLPETVTDEVSAHVEAIAEGLRWELGPSDGDGDRLTLALCWNGDIVQRRLAEQWLEAAPDDDPKWDYAPARPPGGGWEGMSMELGEATVSLGAFVCTVEIDGSRERVDVVLHHPVGAQVGENIHGNAAFLMLDRAFGEDGVERWLGSIDVVEEAPEGAVPIAALVQAVEELEASATGEQFSLMKGERDGLPIFVVANLALKPIDHLACDHHVEIRIPISGANDNGLPDNAEGDRLNALEDALFVKLPRFAYHGRETHAGWRTLVGFAPDDADMRRELDAWAKQQRASVSWTPDPAWEALERWG